MRAVDDAKQLYRDIRRQDFVFFMVSGYLVFSYLRPQAIYPWLEFLPWTQLCVIGGLMALMIRGELKLNFSSFTVLLFALAVLLSCFMSLYPELSFTHVTTPFIWLVEVVFFTNAVRNKEQFRLLLILLVIILFKMSFFGARTWALRGFAFTDWGLAGPSGFFANSGEFSLLMAMFAVLSFCFLYKRPNLNKLYYLVPITAAMTVMGASSRGGQLALLVGCLYLLVWLIKVRIRSVFVVFVLSLLVINFLPEEQKNRFKNMGEDSTSTSRLLYWEAGLEMLEDNPISGVGHMAFPVHFADYYPHLVDQDSYLGARKEVSHNTFVQVGSTLGWLGLVSYVLMILSCVNNTKTLKKASKDNNFEFYYLSFGLNAALIVYLVGSFFMSVAFYPYIYLLLMLSYAAKKTFNEVS